MTVQGSLNLRAGHFHAVIQEAKLYIQPLRPGFSDTAACTCGCSIRDSSACFLAKLCQFMLINMVVRELLCQIFHQIKRLGFVVIMQRGDHQEHLGKRRQVVTFSATIFRFFNPVALSVCAPPARRNQRTADDLRLVI